MFRYILSLTTVAATFMLINSQASAAPQVLAVLSTGNGALMECEGDVCKATLSTFCLQRDRSSPPYRTRYHASDKSHYRLILEMVDGSEKTLPVDDSLYFITVRDYHAVDAILPKSLIDEYEAASVKLVIDEQASLVPDAIPGDPEPLSAHEIIVATGPMRQAASHIVDQGPGAKAIRVLGTMLRGVPEWRGYEQLTMNEMRRDIDEIASGEKLSPEGMEYIEREFAECEALREEGLTYGMAYCLMERHDGAMLHLNKKYWETQAGS